MPKSPIAYIKSLINSGLDRKSISLTDPLAFELFGASPTISGPSITPASALRVPAVYSAIALITGAIGSLPAKVFVTNEDGGKSTAKGHSAYRLVHDEANDFTSAGQLRAQLTADALLHDHGFAFANRVNGVVQEFIRLDPLSITIRTDPTTGEPVYVQGQGAAQRIYRFQDILHVSAPLSLSPIKAGREAIALAVVLESCAARLFNSGARPSSVFTNVAGKNSEVGAKEIKQLKAAYRNATSSGGFTEPMFLDGGWQHAQLALTSVDPQFAAMPAEQIVEIARVFSIPPHLLFELSRATWSNAAEMWQTFLTLALRSWLDGWEWAYARCLLTPEERAAGHYIEFVIDDLTTADTATRAETYNKYRAMGVLTANEVRAGLNREPLPGGDTLDNPNITPGKPAGENDNREPGEAAA